MNRVGRLLFRRLHDELSPADQLALDEWLNQQGPLTRQFFEEATDWEQVQAALQMMYDLDTQAAFEDVQKKIQAVSTRIVSIPVNQTTFRIRKYKWVAVAAIFVLVAGGIVIFAISKRKGEKMIAPFSQRLKNDVAPGGDRAILQLADGREILLDSADNGELVRQGATRVLKLDNGQLFYAASKSQSEAVSYNTISTPKGGQYQVILPDGSKVWLNAASALRFPTSFSGKSRQVELSGEAYFQVAKNATMPFTVQIARPAEKEPLQIGVLGTEFNIMAYSDEGDQRATLIEGAVKVSVAERQLALQPGQQARIKNSYSSGLNLIPTINMDEVIAWKKGLFQFQDAPIQDIMRQVARWYDVEVVYTGKVDQLFIGTIPRNVNISTLLKILESTGWVHFRVEGKKITVFP